MDIAMVILAHVRCDFTATSMRHGMESAAARSSRLTNIKSSYSPIDDQASDGSFIDQQLRITISGPGFGQSQLAESGFFAGGVQESSVILHAKHEEVHGTSRQHKWAH